MYYALRNEKLGGFFRWNSRNSEPMHNLSVTALAKNMQAFPTVRHP